MRSQLPERQQLAGDVNVHGAMTPGASKGTADGMSEDKIHEITELMRHERYRFAPARRIYIPKKNGSAP